MPKLKVKPTPAQARILFELTHHARRIHWWKQSRAGRFEGTGAGESQARCGQPTAATLKRLLAEEWIEHDETALPFGSTYQISDDGRAVICLLEEEDFISVAPLMTTAQIQTALRIRFPAPEWMLVFELSLQHESERRVDAFAVRLHAGDDRKRTKYLTTWVFEIKTSRGDFLHEIKQPEKRRMSMELASCFAFVAPAGMIKRSEIPDDCGLLEVHNERTVRAMKLPPFLPRTAPDWYLVASLCRAIERRGSG